MNTELITSLQKENGMNTELITSLQEENGFSELQDHINTGMAWKLEGSVGRAAMGAMNAGACMLGEESRFDYYGNKVPAREEVEAGTKGSLQNAVDFWSNPENYMD